MNNKKISVALRVKQWSLQEKEDYIKAYRASDWNTVHAYVLSALRTDATSAMTLRAYTELLVDVCLADFGYARCLIDQNFLLPLDKMGVTL